MPQDAPIGGGAVVCATDYGAGHGRVARRRGDAGGGWGGGGGAGTGPPPLPAFDPTDPASVTRRSPDSDEITAVVLRSETGLPCTFAVTLSMIQDPGTTCPVAVSGPRAGLWFGAHTLDLTCGRTADPTETSGAAVCGFEADSAASPDAWFCVYIGSPPGSIAIEILPTSATVDLRQYPPTGSDSHVAVPVDVPAAALRSLVYTVAWRVSNRTAELHVWYGVRGGGGAARIHRTGATALQANVVPRQDTVQVGGTFAYLHQFVWHDAVRTTEDLVRETAALDRSWCSTAP